MGLPREWATKLIGAVEPSGQLSDHPFLSFRPPWQALGWFPRRGVVEGLVNAVVVVVVYPLGNVRNLVDIHLALVGLQGHSGLELPAACSSFSLHCSLGFITQRTRYHFVYPLAPFKGTN
jgi:hypothetical protein